MYGAMRTLTAPAGQLGLTCAESCEGLGGARRYVPFCWRLAYGGRRAPVGAGGGQVGAALGGVVRGDGRTRAVIPAAATASPASAANRHTLDRHFERSTRPRGLDFVGAGGE